MTRTSFFPRLWKQLWGTRLDSPRVVAGLGFLAVVAVLGAAYGYVRAVLAVVMFIVILTVGTRFLRSIVNAPPEPELAEVAEYELRYVCTVCGLELKLEVAAHDKPPRHCMEPMVLVRRGGRPPLRPVK